MRGRGHQLFQYLDVRLSILEIVFHCHMNNLFTVIIFVSILALSLNADFVTNYVTECCQTIDNPVKLMRCVNASAEQSVRDGWSTDSNIKRPKFAFITYATEDIANYAAYAFAVNQAYAENNRYILKLADPKVSNFEPSDPRWNKVKIIEYALDSWANDCDFIVWLDADLIFLDLNFHLEDITGKYPNGDMWVSESTSTDLMNSGLLILRNSPFVRKWMLPEWWNYDVRSTYSDQEVFNMIYSRYKNLKKLDTRVVLVAPDTLNSDPPAAVRQQSTSQVLHLMGNRDIYREKVFKTAFQEICRAIADKDDNDIASEKSQLTLNQPNLLALLLQVYRKELDKAYVAFESTLNRSMKEYTDDVHPSNPKLTYNNFKTMDQLSKLSTHYVEGLDHIESTWSEKNINALRKGYWTDFDTKLIATGGAYRESGGKANNVGLLGVHPESAYEVRERVLRLFFKNIDVQKNMKKFMHPEAYANERAALLWAVIDAGLPYLKSRIEIMSGQGKATGKEVLKTRNRSTLLKETEEIANILAAYSQDMFELAPPQKYPHIHNLRSSLFIHRANLANLRDKQEVALEHLKQALIEKEAENDTSFPKNLINLATMIGDTYCRLKRFRESFPYFDKAIATYERLHSKQSESDPELGELYLLSGEARASVEGSSESAFQLLQRAVTLLQRHSASQKMSRAQNALAVVQKRLALNGGTAQTSSKVKSKGGGKVEIKSPRKGSTGNYYDDEL